MAHYVLRSMHNEIERISYVPQEPRFVTPLLLLHGMWHGAWCWHPWQKLLAEWGWESHAFSLPGHASSPQRRPLPLCTLTYYTRFLAREIAQMPRAPVVLTHSMGGALLLRYLKQADNLPAAVLVAPWPSHTTLPLLWRVLLRDPLGLLWSGMTLSTTPLIRSPRHAAALLLTDGAAYTAEDLHARLGPEAGFVVLQHNPPLWSPPVSVRTPLLWLSAARDAVVPERDSRRSATYYGATYISIPYAGHNLMLEHNSADTAQIIHQWLCGQGVE